MGGMEKAGMGGMEKVKEVADEQLPPPSDVADLVEDDANESSRDAMAEVHKNEEAKLQLQLSAGDDDIVHMMKPAMNLEQNGNMSSVSIIKKTTRTTEKKVVMLKEARMEAAQVEKSGGGDEEERENGGGDEKERENGGGVRETKTIVLEYVDSGEEEIELDLDKFEPHAPHCPNCNHRITKLILRRKIIVDPPKPDIVGYCIICVEFVKTTVSEFLLSIWRRFETKSNENDEPGPVIIPNPEETEDKNEEANEEEDKPGSEAKPIHPEEEKVEEVEANGKDGTSFTTGETEQKPTPKPQPPPEDPNESISIKKPNPSPQQSTAGFWKFGLQLSFSIGRLTLMEILKCIVYGGLIESITSLSVVISAAATDASTLNVLAIGLALLFSGLVAFGMNLVALKDDIKKYEELLGGSKDKFVFHATLAIVSYIVFGAIAPTSLALADNNDYKILAVVAAAFACILILAMAKAHVSQAKDRFRCYVETTRYYLILASVTSGLAYAVGYTVDMYGLKFGSFTSVQRVTCYAAEKVSAGAHS